MIRTRETNLEVTFTRIPPSLTILFYCLALTPSASSASSSSPTWLRSAG